MKLLNVNEKGLKTLFSKKIILSLLIVFCLSVISVLSETECANLVHHPEKQEFYFSGLLLEVVDVDLADNMIDLKFLESGKTYSMNIGDQIENEGISVKLMEVGEFSLPTTGTFSSALLCMNEIEEERFTPPHIIAVGDNSPAEDVMTSNQLINELNYAEYDVPTGTVKLFSEVNAYVAEQKVVVAIYKDEAVIIVGSTVPAEYVVFAVEIANILQYKGLSVDTILDTELESPNLIDLFETSQSCTSQGYKCTSAVRGCGHYDRIYNLDSTCGSTGVICCEEIPYCGDGVCFTHELPGYGETSENCPQDCGSLCTDSDGGQDYYEKGYVQYTLSNGGSARQDDECEGNILGEWTCQNNQPKEIIYNCPNGCSNGACLQTSTPGETLCTDSDGGKNYYVKGEVTGYANQPQELVTFADCCVDNIGKCVDSSDRLVEKYCQDNYWNSHVFYNCPYGCKNGACLKGPVDEEPIEITREEVKCLFVGSKEQQKCYTPEPHKVSCKGKTSCKVDIVGRVGDKITWKSSCGGYAYTRVDGNDEYIKFDCSDDEVNVPTCTDGIWNDGETGVDCGGPCPPCVETPTTCQIGCLSDSTCLPFGTRLVEKETPVFCNLNKEFDKQKQDGELCQNSYECLSNSCHNSVCISLEKELRETRGILQNILEWLRSLFG